MIRRSGEVLGPSPACVTHWPPFDDCAEDPTERRLLRSRAEVKEWLACCNSEAYLPRFDFDVGSCLGAWPVLERDWLVLKRNDGELPPSLGQLPPRESGPHFNDTRKFEEYEIYVANSMGFPIDRYFEFVDEATFKFTHHQYLKGLRHSVQADILRQCRDEQAKRRDANKIWEREKRLCYRHALNAKHGRAAPARPRSASSRAGSPRVVGRGDGGVGLLERGLDSLLGGQEETKHDDDGEGGCVDVAGGGDDAEAASLLLTPSCLLAPGMNLLYHASSCVDKEELSVSTPHVAELRRDVFQFPLLRPEYCAQLAHVALAFREAAGCLSSASVGDGARLPARVCVDKLGLTEDVANELLARVVRPLAARLFPDVGGATLDHQVAFFDGRGAIVRRQTAMDIPRSCEPSGLDAYAYKLEDEAEVCLDVCLRARDTDDERVVSRYLHGSDVDPVEPPSEVSHHTPGTALLYLGSERHSRVVGGPEELHLVLWCRSMKHRALMAYTGDEDMRLYGPLAHEYDEPGVPGPGNHDGSLTRELFAADGGGARLRGDRDPRAQRPTDAEHLEFDAEDDPDDPDRFRVTY